VLVQGLERRESQVLTTGELMVFGSGGRLVDSVLVVNFVLVGCTTGSCNDLVRNGSESWSNSILRGTFSATAFGRIGDTFYRSARLSERIYLRP
jgi:hypothetical protein